MGMDSGMEMYEMPRNAPLTGGGNHTLMNGNEEDVLEATTQGLTTRVEGSQEDDSHTMGAFRRADVAGS